MLLPKKTELHFLLKTLALSLFIGTTAFLLFSSYTLNKKYRSLQTQQAEFTDLYATTLYEEHLRYGRQIELEAALENSTQMLNDLLQKADNQEYQKLQEIFVLYKDISSKLTRNSNAKLDNQEIKTAVSGIGQLLLEEKLDETKNTLEENISKLDAQYKDYLATLPPPPTAAGNGYSYTTVSTERGNFGMYLIKVPLAEVKVVTAAANGDDCRDNCPTKSLAEHVKDNGGYAGINGAYFCPPDYASCSGKVNSSDYAFYKSSSGKWLNKNALSWGDTGLATFNGNSARFYKKSSDYDGDSVSAGVSNYPTLLDNGEVVIDSGKLTSYQRDVKGLRGAIGVGKDNLYLAIISNATVIDAAYAMRALGAQDALNLDGGGSSAMFINGGYVVGPGRSLPSAIVLTK